MNAKAALITRLAALGVSAGAAIAGVFLVMPHEGEVLETYLDPVGIVSSCYGHTGSELRLGQKFSRDECLAQLAEDLVSHETQMMRFVQVPLTEYQHAALLSFCYNVGVGACSKSTAFKKLNAGDFVGACHELTRWVYAKGKRLLGLERRREAELAMCLGQSPVQEISQ